MRVALVLWLAMIAGGCGDDDSPVPDAGAPADAATGRDASPPSPPPSEPGRHDVSVTDSRRVVPSDGLPAETVPLVSNNNLDVIRHEGRVFLAWRTAPDHFAGPDTVIHVVSSDDETSWRFETSYAIGTDLREPRFLSLGGSLFLYVSVLGVNRLSFDPMGVRVAERAPDGTWTAALEDLGMDGYLAWRTRTERGTHYMTAYFGGENIYRFTGEPVMVDLFTTVDGRNWTPLNPAQPTVYTGGGSEADFALADDGTLYGVVRKEVHDDLGWGSAVCSAPAGDLADWSCVGDRKKYDSPLMFWYDGEAYLIARRNVTETGEFDLGIEMGDDLFKTIEYLRLYSAAPKRCALWRWVQSERRIAWILDLPSRGDTCFPARIDGSRPGEIVVYDYTNDPDGPDLNWNDGQVAPTFVYRHVLTFTAR